MLVTVGKRGKVTTRVTIGKRGKSKHTFAVAHLTFWGVDFSLGD